MSAPSGITRVTLLKDLRLEWRSKDAINSMLFFSLLVVVASIAFGPSGEDRGGVVARELYRWRWSIATIWFTAVFLLIVVRFWAYWSTLI